MAEVAIVGVGMTKFGELWDQGSRDMMVIAGVQAVDDANIAGEEIKDLYVGSMSPGVFSGQEHISALAADWVGLKGIGATRVEAACASGGLALRQAYLSVRSGRNDIAIAAGVEKMTDVPSEYASVALMGAGDEEWEGFYGITFPGLYAMMARRHMIEYGTTIEQLSRVSVKSHHNATMNPKAQFRYEITMEQVMNSAPVADPLRLLHCSPITDGAAVVVLAGEERALEIEKETGKEPIWIKGVGLATDTVALHDREKLSVTNAGVLAGRRAYEMAGITSEKIDLAEVHDCFSIAEIMAVESLGFCGFGEGGRLTEEGETSIGGRIPINTSGGLKAKGHPIGATGIAQAIEIVTQLRGGAEKRQVKDAEIGLTHNVGGSGATCVVHILSKYK